MTDLARRWPLEDRVDLRDELLAAYAGTGRRYHDSRHLAEVLDRLDELGCTDPTVLLAAWFHDGVHEGAADDEERSAQWAARTLPGDLAEEVARLVRVTADHRPADDDGPGQLLCDADLAILAAEEDRYDEYTTAVRREYAHVPDRDFATGRTTVLATLLEAPSLFATRHGREHWEGRARTNVEAELRRLREVSAGGG